MLKNIKRCGRCQILTDTGNRKIQDQATRLIASMYISPKEGVRCIWSARNLRKNFCDRVECEGIMKHGSDKPVRECFVPDDRDACADCYQEISRLTGRRGDELGRD